MLTNGAFTAIAPRLMSALNYLGSVSVACRREGFERLGLVGFRL